MYDMVCGISIQPEWRKKGVGECIFYLVFLTFINGNTPLLKKNTGPICSSKKGRSILPVQQKSATEWVTAQDPI